MDGENDGAAAQVQVEGQQAATGDQAAQAPAGARAGPGEGALVRAGAGFEAALAGRD